MCSTVRMIIYLVAFLALLGTAAVVKERRVMPA